MEQLKQAHLAEYGICPEVTAVSPGRIHLIGEHSWYFKDKTLSMAVNLPVYVAISTRDDSSLRFFFPQLKERKKASVATLKYRKEDRWANALKAVIYSFGEFGFRCKGMDITVWSDILPSAGFGITTAIKTATAAALRHLFAKDCDDRKLMKMIQFGNMQFLEASNNLADLFAAFYSKEDTCILTDHSKSSYVHLPFNFQDYTVILTDTRVPRVSVWNEETVRTAENFLLLAELKVQKNGYWIYEESDIEINDILSRISEDTRRRLLCIMHEHKYVMDAAEGLKNGNFQVFGRSVNRSHEEMRDMYNISCPEVDWLVKRVLEMDSTASSRMPSACSRITGKGFGRCSYSIIKKESLDEYVRKLAEYERIFGFHPSWYEVKPAEGTTILES